MLIRLQALNTEFAEVSLERVAGERAHGHYRLLLTLMVHLRGRQNGPPFRLSDFEAFLRTGRTHDGQLHVVRLLPSESLAMIEAYPEAYSTSVLLVGELDRARIEALEAERRGGELKWTIWIRATTTREERVAPATGQGEIAIAKSAWLDVLKQAGYQRTIQVEVPLRPGGRTHLARAVMHLAKAQELLNGGDARQAVATCRDGLEALSQHVGGDDSKATFDRASSKNDRLLVLRRAAKQLPHAAKHSDDTVDKIEWSIADAEMVIAVAAAMIRRECES